MVANPQPGQRVLDIAGGTGDLALAFARRVGPGGHTDINGHAHRARPPAGCRGDPAPPVCDAGRCLFRRAVFDVVVAFGLRNMTHKDQALREMARAQTGRSAAGGVPRVAQPAQGLRPVFVPVLPRLGRLVAGDADGYRTWPNRSACIPTRKNSRR